MADVLLTHSYHLAYDRKQVRKMQPYPPLATLYAAALLRESGISVAVHDTMLTDIGEFSKALAEHRPKIVAVYDDDFNFLTKMCLTNMREVAWDFALQAKVAGALVLAHGSDAADHSAAYLDNSFDAVLLGEAEQTLLDVCTRALKAYPWEDVPGLVLKHGDRIISNPPRRPSDSIEALPKPARDLIDLEPYRKAWIEAHGYFSLNMVSSRGCPFRCNWCAKPIFGDHFALRSAESVAKELLRMREEYGAEHIWFADDIFALNRHWIQAFARELERLGCALPFKIQTRAELLTAATVDALKRAGCNEVWMGVESGSQAVLDAMDKGLTPLDVVMARERLRAAGIRACFFLQFGYPGERWEDLEKTIALVRNTRPDDIGVSLSYPLPNTKFHTMVQEQMGRKRNWKDSDDLCVIFKAAYTDTFYRSVRDALHCEVDSWHGRTTAEELVARWGTVRDLEPVSRNADPTEIIPSRVSEFVPISSIHPCAREV
jgi:anaerobic magnesium-protoporphyrin IX monomethyl ester cyclase